MKNKMISLGPAVLALGIFSAACRPASAFPQQASVQEPAAPPPPHAYAPAPPPDAPPPPRARRRPGPPPPSGAVCGPDTAAPPRPGIFQQLPASTIQGTIRQFNFGREGEVSGFLLSSGTQVNFPPEVGEQIGTFAKVKTEVSIVGFQRQSATGKAVVDATLITANGQTFVLSDRPTGPMNPPPPPPANGGEPGPPQN